MKRSLFVIFVSLLFIGVSQAQDQITRLNGKTIDCEIKSIDSTKIAFLIDISGNQIETNIELTDVLSYKYQGKETIVSKAKISEALQKSYVKPAEVILADSVEKAHEFFIYTYAGEVIPGRLVENKTPFIGIHRILVDSQEYRPNMVKFFKNETGFYANTKYMISLNKIVFARRIRKGKISLYEVVKINYNIPHANPGGLGMGYGFNTKEIMNYYNKGFGDLKKAKYKFLKDDLADSPESKVYLNKFKSTSRAVTILAAVGSGLMVGGLVMIMNKTKDYDGTDKTPEPNLTSSYVTIGIGSGCLLTGILINFSKPNILRKAVDAYNK